MKIGVFHNLPSGGAKRSLYGFVKYLTRAGHKIDVFVPSTANESFLPLKEFARDITILPVQKTLSGFIKSTIRYIPPIRIFRISLADLDKTHKKLATIINYNEYDVVYVEQDQFTMSPFILKYIEKPFIYYCPQPMRSSEAILERVSEIIKTTNLIKKIFQKYVRQKLEYIDRKNASFAKLILTNSYFSREAILRAYGLDSFVCYLGVDTETFRPLNMEREPYVLSVGRISYAKGFDFIIRSLGLLEKSIRPRLVIAADSIWEPWKIYLEKLAIQSGVKLEIKVLVNDSEMVKLYNRAKLCVYAPYLEPFGLVSLEAMACGTPVVAVKEGGIRECVINNETGVLLERDENLFAKAVRSLLLEEERWKKMSQKAIEAVREFWTLEHASKRLLQYLERAINLHHAYFAKSSKF